jgi:CO/xanthine dehydrogenase FAD-binding subunit
VQDRDGGGGHDEPSYWTINARNGFEARIDVTSMTMDCRLLPRNVNRWPHDPALSKVKHVGAPLQAKDSPAEGEFVDINTVTEIVRRPSANPGLDWRTGDAWLAGGTWLFSDRQPDVRRLIDLVPLRWDSLTATDSGLEIGAMCTIRDLYALRAPQWRAAPLLSISCEAFLASFKIWNSATVGGNICMSLPAGPMITMTVALEATYTMQDTTGAERSVAAADFVTGNHTNILTPGELLRRVDIPVHALRKRYAHRRFTLTHLGRSTIFMVATQTPGASDLALTITAGTTHPVRLVFDTMPDADTLVRRIDDLDDAVWFDDPNGTPDHRRHLARHFAEELRTELSMEDS